MNKQSETRQLIKTASCLKQEDNKTTLVSSSTAMTENSEKQMRELVRENQLLQKDIRRINHIQADMRVLILHPLLLLYKRLRRAVFRFLLLFVPFTGAGRSYRTLRSAIRIINRSNYFDSDWYMLNNPQIPVNIYSMAEHYYQFGWKEGADPSPVFSSGEYLRLNPDVAARGICPLLHYELHGKYEQRRYSAMQEDIPILEKPRKAQRRSERNLKRRVKKQQKIKIENNKIVFLTFQGTYVCNPKYICEELLKQQKNYDIVWLYNPQTNQENFPSSVRLVPWSGAASFAEISSARLMIDNGRHMFSDKIFKRDGQTSISTWHGSFGFKKLFTDTGNGRLRTGLEYDRLVYDYLYSNSDFEDMVYRTSQWPLSTIMRFGHARNDILVNPNPRVASNIKNILAEQYGFNPDAKLLLYAPTFRAGDMQDEYNDDLYQLPIGALRTVLRARFGGEWIFMIRHHFVNRKVQKTAEKLTSDSIDVTDYPDIQELMLVADIGITDYSSWILDYILTRKPGFLFVKDEESYRVERDFYYPIDEAPLPVARSNKELLNRVLQFDAKVYEKRINKFLLEKGSVEDGYACKRIVDHIDSLMGKS